MTPPPEKALCFFDVDGTLMYEEEPLSRPVVESLLRFAARGHVPVLCTGRPHHQLCPELTALPWAAVITLAGAVVRLGDALLQDRCIPPSLLLETARRLEAAGVGFTLQGDAACCRLGEGGPLFPGTVRLGGTHELEGRFPGLPFAKIEFMDAYLPMVHAQADFFQGHFSLQDIAIGVHEMTLPGINKAAAARQVLAALGGAPSRTYAIGDSENDMGLLHMVDVPIVMGNALPQVKAAARYVTAPVQEDGVAQALAHFGLA